MITREDIIQELIRRGIDPNQIPSHTTRLGAGWPQAKKREPLPAKEYLIKPGFATRNAPAILGGVGGGVGTALGGPALGIPLAALGGAAGKAIQQEKRQVEGEDIPYGKMFKEQAKSAAWEGGTEAVIPFGKVVGKKVLKPMIKRVIPKAPFLSDKLADIGDRLLKSKFAKELVPEQAEYLVKGGRVHITAAGQTVDPFVDHAEEMMRGSLFGSPLEILRTYLHPKTLQLARSEFSEGLWKEIGRKMSPRDVGYLFRESIEDRQGFAKKIISALYKNLDDVSKGAAKVDLQPAKASALKEIDNLIDRMGKGPARETRILAKQVASLPDFANFSDAIYHHSDILYAQRALQARVGELAPKNPQAARFVGKIQSLIDNSMKRTAEAHSPEMARLYDVARRAKSKLHEDIISNKFIKGTMKLAENKPEVVAPFIFKSYETTAAVRKIAPPKTWKALVAAQMEEILQASAKETAGNITEEATEQVVRGRTFLAKFEGLGDDVINEMFPSKAHVEAIMDFGQMHRLVQDPIGASGGKMLIKLVQAGAIVATALGKVTGTSGVILLGPKELSKLMASETGIRWLTLGLKVPEYSPIAPTILVRILREAGMSGGEIETPKVTPSETFNPFRNFPGPPRLTPESGIFGTEKEDKQELQTELILKTTR